MRPSYAHKSYPLDHPLVQIQRPTTAAHGALSEANPHGITRKEHGPTNLGLTIWQCTPQSAFYHTGPIFSFLFYFNSFYCFNLFILFIFQKSFLIKT